MIVEAVCIACAHKVRTNCAVEPSQPKWLNSRFPPKYFHNIVLLSNTIFLLFLCPYNIGGSSLEEESVTKGPHRIQPGSNKNLKQLLIKSFAVEQKRRLDSELLSDDLCVNNILPKTSSF